MTDDLYCWDCARARGRAAEGNDFVGLCSRDDNIAVPCAGCAEVVWVDHRGRRVEGTGVPVVPQADDAIDLRPPLPTPRAAG
jgi:hypothetical protein